MKKNIKLKQLCFLIIATLASNAPKAESNPLPQSQACEKLQSFALNARDLKSKSKDVLYTDSFIYYQENDDGSHFRYDWHNLPFKKNSVHPLWSASKAIFTTVAAYAVQQGKLDLEEPVIEALEIPSSELEEIRQKNLDFYLRAHKNKKSLLKNEGFLSELKVKHLIDMTSGLDWFEHEDHGIPSTSSLEMLYGPRSANMLHYMLGLPFLHKPGLAWNYSSGNTIILSAILEKKLGQNFLKNTLFKELGITQGYFENDQSQTSVGSSFGYLTPDEMLQFGQLFLNNGRYNGKQLLPPDWIEKASQAHPSYLNPETDAKYVEKEQMVYGLGFAVNEGFPTRGISQPFPSAPKDMFFAAGHFGQLIIIIPSEKVIIVRTGFDKSYWSKVGYLSSLSLACFKAKKELPILVERPKEKTGILQRLKDGSYLLTSGWLANALSKEICSCRYTTGLSLENCIRRNKDVPYFLSGYFEISENKDQRSITLKRRQPKDMSSPKSMSSHEHFPYKVTSQFMGSKLGCVQGTGIR